MDTLLLGCPSTAKRPCCTPPSDPLLVTASPRNSILKPDPMDRLLESFLGLSDSTSTLSLDLSFDRLLESRPCDSDQNDMIERAMRLGSVLLEAGKRSARKRATMHNAVVWALPPDLTTKVFSVLDTQSVCYAAATCTLFRKCTMDPLCYANIDLTAEVPRVNNVVVSTFIQRAGKVLQSLKLGIVPGPTASPGSSQPLVYTIRNSADAPGFSWNDKRSRQGKESFSLTRSCLSSLSGDSDAPGARLRRLHLYNIERMDNAALCAALSACPSLLDLEIVGLFSSDSHVELRQTLESVSKYCHLIERLYFEASKAGRDDSLKWPTCNDLVKNCPHITSLALRGFKLHDNKVRVLVKGFHKLKYLDFSTSYSITGGFLRNLGGDAGGNQLEVEVARMCTAVIAGDFKILRHLVFNLSSLDFTVPSKQDISNREGLASAGDWYHRCYRTRDIPVKQLLEERAGFCLVAEFPPEGSFIEIEQMVANEAYSDLSSPSQPSSHTSDGSGTLFTSSTESSYNSDQGSGNEDGREASYIIYEESSDEVDFLVG
ncbi:hypothetical protein RHGRI_035764 [Rhododendron griersonianum]|uniref:F-box domain-containing protein n=1 Tax=Rhododendron griersonianum TaxID=479676 RepID=A0AAV6HLB4_9ERIC|nr:hypothetical protein RHGRI_035764 [Rhododendron griersonianum]